MSEEEKRYEVFQYPTSHMPVVRTPEGEILTPEQAQAEILNLLSKVVLILEKSLSK